MTLASVPKPPSLLEAAQHFIATPQTSLSVNQHSNKEEAPSYTCYEFVNKALKATLPPQNWQDLIKRHQDLLETLPPAHRCDAIIPYHYALLAQNLANGEKDWLQSIPLHQVLPGDLMIYIAEGYDPDPQARKEGVPSGTHCAFIHDWAQYKKDCFVLTLLDATNRPYGRSLSPDLEEGSHIFQKTTKLSRGSVAYSLMTLQGDVSSKEACVHIAIKGIKPFQGRLFFLKINLGPQQLTKSS